LGRGFYERVGVEFQSDMQATDREGMPCLSSSYFNLSWNKGKLQNEELHGLYSSPSIVRVIKARRMRWAGRVARMGEVRGAYNILVGRPEGRRPLGRRRRRWENNIKMDLWEIGFGDVGLIWLRIGTGAIKCG
jgi:hypothetical protein